ncbi:PCNA-interacting partner-like isoform X1 [Lytechinus pictus]|uniref:PCNA-interacting partner-like isoform X1 n=1 Tax=Lytechinus pictus TaxID=7653 RepID=UPI0030BA2036
MMDLKEAISSSPDDILVIGNHGNQSHDTILRHLNSVSCDLQQSDQMDVHLLGSRTKSSGYPKLCTLAQHFIERYRHGLAANDRQTVLSHSSHLLMVQLCLAERSKQKHDLFEVDMSEVLLTSRELLQQKLSCAHKPTNDSSPPTPEPHPLMNMYEGMLKRCNMVDMVDVWREVRKAESKRREEETNGSLAESKTKFVILHPPQGDIECTMLSSLSGNERPSTITALTFDPSSPSTDEEECEDVMRLEVSTERLSWDQGISALHDFQSASTPSVRSPTETFCRQLFLSHLALLINTRDELSLAHCLSLPDKGLGIEGFTALRKAAQEKNMPMFQTMVSFIMKLRLGGKSYAPDLSSPLGEYVKPMGDFVNLIQKMQTLAEETKDPREAIKKILHTIKISILKSDENVLKAGSLEKAVADLTRETEYLINYTEEKTPKKIVGQGRVIYGQKTIYVIRNLVDRQSGAYMSKLTQTQLLTDTVCSQKTPVKLPSVISQFRTPDVECDPDSPENVSLRDRLRKSLGGDEEASKTPQVHGPKSFMIWAEPVVKITSINDSPPANQNPNAQIPANQNKGLWADSPDDRSLAHKKRLSGLTPDLIDSIVSTPKRKTHLLVESVDETENMTDDSKVKDVKKKNKKNKEMSKKRLILNELNADDSQPAKKAKKAEPKPKKKKTVPLVKGQQTLNRFFRV